MAKKIVRRTRQVKPQPKTPAKPAKPATKRGGQDAGGLDALLDTKPSKPSLADLLGPAKELHFPVAMAHNREDTEAILLNKEADSAEIIVVDNLTGLVLHKKISTSELSHWGIVEASFGWDPIKKITVKLPIRSIKDVAATFRTRASSSGATKEAAEVLNTVLGLAGKERVKVNTAKVETARKIISDTPVSTSSTGGRRKRTEAQKLERRRKRQAKLNSMTPAAVKAWRDARNAKRKLRRANARKRKEQQK